MRLVHLVLCPLLGLVAPVACGDDSPDSSSAAGQAGDSAQAGSAPTAGSSSGPGQGGVAGASAGASGESGAPSEAGAAGTSAGESGAGGGGAAGTTSSACEPASATTCGSEQTCLSTRHDGATGACMKSGTRAAGAGCNPKLNHTGCAPGLLCAVEPHGDHAHPTCRPICPLLATDPGCPEGHLCTAGYLVDDFTSACLPAHERQQDSALDQPCPPGALAGDPCGKLAGIKYQGACAAIDPATTSGPLTCRKLCAAETGGGCDASTSCRPLLDLGTLGVCAP